MAKTMCSALGEPVNDEPTQTPVIAPTRYCPWPPMLKRPQRNANATASPVSASVVAVRSVCWRLNASIEAVSHQNQKWLSENGTSRW
jgi:hypothetical protein